jgi:hypothetical protein
VTILKKAWHGASRTHVRFSSYSSGLFGMPASYTGGQLRMRSIWLARAEHGHRLADVLLPMSFDWSAPVNDMRARLQRSATDRSNSDHSDI